MAQERKSYDELTFADDFLFCKIMEKYPDIARELLERILNKPIRKVVINTQESVKEAYDAKGVRFDVYIEDDSKTVYDVEMQTTKKKELPLRTRYYQGMIDLKILESGGNYSNLKESYIIFICMSDPFGKGRHLYAFENRCVQDLELKLGDNATKIFLNVKGTMDDVSPELHNFLAYLTGKEVSDPLIDRIRVAVEKSKKSRRWRKDFMTMQEKMDECREEGRAEGETKGKAENLIRNIKSAEAKLGSLKQALDFLDVTEEEYEKALKLMEE